MRIAIISKAPFPKGNASSSYILNVARLMKLSGNDVSIIGCFRGVDMQYPIGGEIEGIKYMNYDTTKKNRLQLYYFERRWGHWVVKQIKKQKLDIAFLFGGTVSSAKMIQQYCNENQILYGAFNCEWFTPETLSSIESKKSIDDICGIVPYNAKHSDIAIVISSLLKRYFDDNKVKTIMIPNVIDLKDSKWNCSSKKNSSEKLKLAYAGMPGEGKDELGVIIEAIDSLNDELKNNIELHIWGPTREVVIRQLSFQLEQDYFSKNNIYIHGRADQDSMPQLLNTCDFTVLIRKPSLRTNAGFSTKLVESFAAGVPVIANITGDIGSFLIDGENGIIANDDSVESCCEAIRRAYEMKNTISEMKNNSIRTAKTYFDYRVYESNMKDFFHSISV